MVSGKDTITLTQAKLCIVVITKSLQWDAEIKAERLSILQFLKLRKSTYVIATYILHSFT